MPKFINKNNILDIVIAGENPDPEDRIQFDRIKTITDGENKITQFHPVEDGGDPRNPIIETVDISGLDPKFTKFDDTVTGDYFVNTPFKVMSQTEKNVIIANDVKIKASQDLQASDAGMVRVIDDILEFLVNGTELPQIAKDKLTDRKNLRDKI